MKKKIIIEVTSGLQCIAPILYFSYNYDHFGFSDRTIITVRPEDKKVDEGMYYCNIIL